MELVVNMKRKRLYLLVIIFFLLTGCSNVSYDLDIYINSFEEKLSFDYGSSYISNTLIEDNINNITSLKDENIEYTISGSTAEIIHKFDDIHFIEQNEVIKGLYDRVIISKIGNITTVRLQDYNNARFVCGEFDEGCLLTLDKVTFTLSSEYQIISSNADLINDKKNQHTWIFNEQIKDEFYFSYSDKIRWDIVVKNFIEKNSTILVISGIILFITIVMLVLVGIFIRKNKENNS